MLTVRGRNPAEEFNIAEIVKKKIKKLLSTFFKLFGGFRQVSFFLLVKVTYISFIQCQNAKTNIYPTLTLVCYAGVFCC